MYIYDIVQMVIGSAKMGCQSDVIRYMQILQQSLSGYSETRVRHILKYLEGELNGIKEAYTNIVFETVDLNGLIYADIEMTYGYDGFSIALVMG